MAYDTVTQDIHTVIKKPTFYNVVTVNKNILSNIPWLRGHRHLTEN